jgi:hypothetical protein
LNEGHQRRLAASLEAMDGFIRQMKQAAMEGRSPSGRKLTPLEADEWDTLAAPLQQINDGLRQIVQTFAPELLAARDTVEGRGATYRWLALLLLQLESDVIDPLKGASMGRYGKLSESERDAMEGLTAEMRERLAEARSHLAAIRAMPKP